MSNFTPLVEKEYEFEGDNVKIRFARLKRVHMLRALPAFYEIADKTDDENFLSKAGHLLGDIIDEIPGYVKEFEGLKDANGEPVSIMTVCEDFYFTRLAMQIAMDMVKESAPLASKND